MVTAPKSCGEAVELGVKTSRFLTLDPDGHSVKEEPIVGFCDVPTGTTVLENDITVEVGKCEGLHCFQHNMSYSAPVTQMVALIDSSGNCSQSIKVDCQSAPLKVSLIELVSKDLNHFGVIAGLFRQIGGHSSRFVLFCSL